MINILFIAHFDAYYSSFIGLANSLKFVKGFSSTILFPMEYPNVRKHIEDCTVREVNFKACINLKRDLHKPPPYLQIAHLALKCVLAAVRTVYGVSYIAKMISLKARMKSIRRQLRELSPSIIVLGGDIVGHDMALYIRCGRDLGIPSVIMPSWMASAREPAEIHLYNPRYSLQNPFNWIFCQFFPNWRFHHKGRSLIRLPSQEALALLTLHLAPPLPWTLHSGYADAIGVESEVARNYGIREGLDPQRLVVTGSKTHDVLYNGMKERNARRNALYDRYYLDAKRALVVCALPPDMLYVTGGRPECEFTDYRALIAGFLEPIFTQLGARFLVCPHPSSNSTKLAFVEEHGAIVAEEPVAELLSLADIYVASISATIQWAIACAIPVINYDVYRYRYTDYAGLAGVLTLETQDAYVDALARMIDDPSFRTARAEDQRLVSKEWGVLDGKANERILKLICDLSTTPPSLRSSTVN